MKMAMSMMKMDKADTTGARQTGPAHGSANPRAKAAFPLNEPKLLTSKDYCKQLIFNMLLIKKTRAQENNTIKNEPKGIEMAAGSKQKHRVAVTEETVTLPHGFPVGAQYYFAPA